jgi:hypothetical protein
MSSGPTHSAEFPGDRRWLFLDAHTTQDAVAQLPPAASERIVSTCHRLARLCCSFGLPHVVAGRSSKPLNLAARQLLAPAASVLDVPPDDIVDAFRVAQAEGRSCSWYLPVVTDGTNSLALFASILESLRPRLLVYGAAMSADIEPLLRGLHAVTSECWFVRDAVHPDFALPVSSNVVSFAEIEAAHTRWAAG